MFVIHMRSKWVMLFMLFILCLARAFRCVRFICSWDANAKGGKREGGSE